MDQRKHYTVYSNIKEAKKKDLLQFIQGRMKLKKAKSPEKL